MGSEPDRAAFAGGGSATAGRKRRGFSAFWTRQFHTWHWMSSAICLVVMLLFAITGITLNHAGDIEASPQVASREATMPASVLKTLRQRSNESVPPAAMQWLDDEFDVDLAGRAPEWSADELYIALPRPGGDGWVSVDLETGLVIHEDTDRGTIAWLNDLHKGRDTGPAWAWFIDIFAVACIVFCATGFLLLQLHARRRPSTWPIVAAGVVIPILLLVFLMH
ncbi:hypothetical protein F7D01_11780 [Erythrobacter sp. 3-20A1M]|uniref:PepSY-associated TM helix domain-containing protein n=1 Tax=Erythrobacter sp. 3-20A1M TaxID=2653850 RepID=UPI001BFC70BF|nr:PepSY-associated TM helix domain-containing protein [Erythrobacter sp. 3-20A1M]QWC58430.1 hypothetical protein F7D01_11780 [Erythrobacter sp. 3-20A1M]